MTTRLLHEESGALEIGFGAMALGFLMNGAIALLHPRGDGSIMGLLTVAMLFCAFALALGHRKAVYFDRDTQTIQMAQSLYGHSYGSSKTLPLSKFSYVYASLQRGHVRAYLFGPSTGEIHLGSLQATMTTDFRDALAKLEVLATELGLPSRGRI
ncbi:hypothetical protein SAMN02745857_03033 [Andreprevotia lacus DSM 23236]|jgi:hypothetical protein|uniref:Uncharacterized protein n=1 Tax=Andreprevotia lacus DSM 23236 TaxID=1121001 RepID=A0A1W1XVH0_9NEIS|nr:hypothetical protein [Andreprevotia lacus]SMC27923.1 hypothetical protein SAMN02745857_03033 [Andreprevotia lacus DSM 23236]